MTTAPLPDWIAAACPEARTAVPLSGEAPGGAAEPWLVHTPQGPALFARLGEQVQRLDLDGDGTRYEARVIGDQLHLPGATLGVPLGRAEAARELVASARLQAWAGQGPCAPRPMGPSPWIVQAPPAAGTWAGCRLAQDELLIAWLPSTTEAPLQDPWEPEARAAWAWCLTTHRDLLVALSPLGLALEVELPRGTVLVDGGGTCHAGDRRWQVERKRLALARQLAPLCGLGPAQRLREAARSLGVSDDAAARAQALRLLDHLGADAQPDDLLRRAVVERLVPPLPAAFVDELAALPATPGTTGDDLVSWVEAWSVPEPLARAVLAVLRDADPVFALPLHEVLHERAAIALRSGRVDRGGDLDLARHHLEAGRPDGVEALLSRHVAALEPGGLDRVLPEPGQHLATEPAGPLAEELGVLDALAAARDARGLADAGLRAELARRQPLVAGRIAALADSPAEPGLRDRATAAVALLEQGLAPAQDLPGGKVAPLSEGDLDAVRHPVTRSGGTLARLSRALARVEPPDAGAIRDYCERLDPARHPAAAAALADAAVMLGMPAVPAFVSRGDRRVGLRGHERPEPFLVIGGAHLEAEGGFTMTPAELAFAVGAELAHLRWQHSRVTSEDVWAGLWDKGGLALSATASLLPLLELLRMPGKLARLGAAGAGAISTLRDAGSRLSPDKGGKAGPTDMGVEQARLLAVHRAMQLSADRAGLLLCGDPAAAVRAMMLQHSRLRAELDVAERQGLASALLRRDDQDALLLPHLAVRVGALLAFWLSDSFAELRDRLRPGGVTN